MPTNVGPNTKGEENLVFGYDLGDVSNSYKGEPTTNIIDGGANRATAVTGVWTHGNHAGANSSEIANIDLSATYPNRSSVIKVKTTNATGYGMINQRMSTNAISGSTYTYSFDYKQIAYDGTWTPTAGAYGDGYKVPNSSYTNVNTTYQYIPLSDGWTRFVMTYDATYTGRNTLRSNMQTNNTADFEILFDNFQIQAGDRVTPFTAGTRSATQGLLDLTGNSTIDLTDVSFDSNAQPDWDGTDDSFEIDTHVAEQGNVGSIEVVFKADDNHRGAMVGWGDLGTSNWGSFEIGPSTSGYSDEFISYVNSSAGSGYTLSMMGRDSTDGSYKLNDGVFHHAVAVVDGVNNTIYVDGQEVGTLSYQNGSATAQAFINQSSTTNVRIGNSTYNGGHIPFDGQIPYVKIYDRGLTAAEIQSNFNAIKGRFNI